MIGLAMKLGLAAPLQFMLPHHVAPPAPVVAVVVPAPAHITPEATTTTTTSMTEPTAQPGPQPVGTSVTSTVTDCVVQWPTTGTNPDGTSFTSTGFYEGDCATAAQVAATNPGATLTPNTFQMTS